MEKEQEEVEMNSHLTENTFFIDSEIIVLFTNITLFISFINNIGGKFKYLRIFICV